MPSGFEARQESRKMELKVVGRSGQISLGKQNAGKTFEVERLEDGSVLLRAVAMVPASQLWTLEEPHRSRIARGLAWAAATPPRESDPADLLKPRARRRSPARGRAK